MYIILKWLDTTFIKMKYLPSVLTYAIIKSFLRAALTSYIILGE
jgi:hypothetical protein